MARTNALAFVGTNYTLSKNCHSDGETERKRYDLAEEKPLKSNKQTNKQTNKQKKWNKDRMTRLDANKKLCEKE